MLHRHATVRSAGAQLGDVDINRQQISISKSRYLGFEAATKTAASEREIKIVAQVAEARKAIKPLGVSEDMRALRATGMRPRMSTCSLSPNVGRAK